MRRGRVAALTDDDAVPATPATPTRHRRTEPLPWGGSLLIWAVMALLAWGVVALVIHFL